MVADPTELVRLVGERHVDDVSQVALLDLVRTHFVHLEELLMRPRPDGNKHSAVNGQLVH